MLQKINFRTKLGRSLFVFGMMVVGFTAVDLHHHDSFQIWLLQALGVAVGAFAVLVPVYYYERQDRLNESEGNKAAAELQALR